MKSFTKKVAMVKQNAMEKMGKSESHADNDATKETKEKLRVIKTEYNAIYTTGKLHCQETEKSVQQGVQFGEALNNFGSAFMGDEQIADILKRMGLQIKAVEQARQTCNNNSMTSLVTPVGKFQDTEIKRAREAKHKQDAIRLRYDTHLEKLAEAKKKNDANSLKVKTIEQECNDIKEEYDVVNREFNEIMEHLNQEMNKQLVAELREFALQQLSFYKQASALWAEADEILCNLPA
ncbi:hypothetical protein SAMD00019534_036830 [Acytostelium subglobosum LB1]|uniref:hypothetical protein n=1 Tax=Acytostelium subglobosum LB1 TaxID=1410327 RepID=UPI000644A70C|nr:hypothetical protein SAMD00019534_036830 [Acytostelium subglobosum LB1]GAM20508.1 hypothetical protein SAMD00019534_036830 [Acytostelium subglobosum LB1]|eukprot:XP_012760029.1 hypothetical protein SAMD00019534_036830 [Acytostelium subglobosum LB1]